VCDLRLPTTGSCITATGNISNIALNSLHQKLAVEDIKVKAHTNWPVYADDHIAPNFTPHLLDNFGMSVSAPLAFWSDPCCF